MTSAANNNALNLDGFQSLRKDNDALRKFVDNYKTPPANQGVQNVMLLDWSKLADSLIVANAQTMGISAEMAFSHTVTCDGPSKRESWYPYCPQPHLTAMVCSGTTPPSHPKTITSCPEDKRGRLSPDGLHWCSATTGPRSTGGILCLIHCAIDADESFEESNDERSQFLKSCQDRCNSLWMNMDSFFVEDESREDGSVLGHLEIPL